MTKRWLSATILLLSLLFNTAALAQSSPFGAGWRLEGEASSLQFQSIKNGSTIETSGFATYSGGISPDGDVSMTVLLDSVDTKIDLRNVRMRFLFFETFTFPEAKVSARIEPAMIVDLEEVRRKTVAMPFTLELHGVSRTLEAQLSLTLIGDDLVAVSTAEPITLAVADYNLMGGLEKLQEAAGVTIVPSSSVSFDLIFRKIDDGSAQPVQAAAETTAPAPTSAALETAGNFTGEACIGRFEILSRTGNIFFRSGSSQLDDASEPVLRQVADIIGRCPDFRVRIEGHTDSIGSDSANMRLSERRAASVRDWLRAQGVPADRVESIGFGETRPVADNATDAGRSRNRRIEFSVSGT
ncbi:MAG: OmpA family protein [Pseudooceanicola sp.]